MTLYMAHEHWLVCPTHVLWRHGRERLHRPRVPPLHAAATAGRPSSGAAPGYLERELEQVDAFIAMSEFSRDKHREFGFPRTWRCCRTSFPIPTPARCRR